MKESESKNLGGTESGLQFILRLLGFNMIMRIRECMRFFYYNLYRFALYCFYETE